jgi:hypothetical protein
MICLLDFVDSIDFIVAIYEFIKLCVMYEKCFGSKVNDLNGEENEAHYWFLKDGI